MPVQIVEQSRLLRDMFFAICREANVPVARSTSRLADLPELGTEDLVLFHSNEKESQLLKELETFRKTNPAPPLVLVTKIRPSPEGQVALGKVVHAVFPESKPAEALLAILQVVRAGYRAFSHGDADHFSEESPAEPQGPRLPGQSLAEGTATLASQAVQPSQAPAPQGLALGSIDVDLSERERTILQCLMYGASNKSIANDLGICEATVKVHLRTCFRKIGVRNRTQAAIWASERLGPPLHPVSSGSAQL